MNNVPGKVSAEEAFDMLLAEYTPDYPVKEDVVLTWWELSWIIGRVATWDLLNWQ